MTRASAAIPTAIAAPRSTPVKKMFWGESICDHSDEGYREAGEDYTVGSVAIQKSTNVDAEPEPAREADHEQVASLGEQPCDHDRGDNPDNGQ